MYKNYKLYCSPHLQLIASLMLKHQAYTQADNETENEIYCSNFILEKEELLRIKRAVIRLSFPGLLVGSPIKSHYG